MQSDRRTNRWRQGGAAEALPAICDPGSHAQKSPRRAADGSLSRRAREHLRHLPSRAPRPLRIRRLRPRLCRGDGGGGDRPHQRARSRHLERGTGRKLQAADRFHEAAKHCNRHSARPWRPQVVVANGHAGHGTADRGEPQGRSKDLAARGADGRAGCQRLAHAAAANDSRLQSDGPHLGGCGEKRGQGRLRCDRNSRSARLSARFVPVSGLEHT